MRDSGYFSKLREFLSNERRGRKEALSKRRRTKRASPFRMEQLEARVLLAGDLASVTLQAAVVQEQYTEGAINIGQASHNSGYAYYVSQNFGTTGDSNAAPTVSKLRIYENGQELGPAHSLHADIRTQGDGRFSHWGNELYFSASDNSNPLTNGRSYTYRVYTDGSTSTTTTPTTTTPTTTTTSGSIKTDFGVYKEPALPSLPSSGSKIIDPTFGTTILRLTDGRDGSTNAQVGYSNLPSFNRDNSYVMAVENLGGSRAKFYTFDPVNFSSGNGFVLSKPPSGLQEYGLIWSGVNRQVTFGVGQNKIWQIDVSTQQATLVKDLTSYGAGGYITQMSKSLNDDVFSASIVNSSGSTVGYVVYKRSTDTVLLRNTVSNLDEVQVDKSGRYFIAVYKDGHDEIWDLQAGPKLTATLSGSSGFRHRDTGFGTAFTSYSGNSLGFRQLSSPTTVKALVPGYWGYSANNQQDHFSMLADNEGWGLASRYSTTGSGVAKTFDNEIVLVATNGSNQVRRLAHHRSVMNDYGDTPRANISRDGQFIAFTSNWGNANGRRDVYIVKVPPAPMI